MVVIGCLAFGVMTLPTWCVSVLRRGKSEGVTVLGRGGWHMTLVEWLSTPLERPSHGHNLCGGCVWKAQGAKSRKAHMVGVVVVK